MTAFLTPAHICNELSRDMPICGVSRQDNIDVSCGALVPTSGQGYFESAGSRHDPCRGPSALTLRSACYRCLETNTYGDSHSWFLRQTREHSGQQEKLDSARTTT